MLLREYFSGDVSCCDGDGRSDNDGVVIVSEVTVVMQSGWWW